MNPTSQPTTPSSSYSGNPFDDPALTQARQNSTQATQAAQGSAQADITLPDMLRSALASKFSSDNPLYANRETAAKNYLDSTTSAPLSVLPENNNGVVFNPMQQANLIQGRESSALAPLLTANSLLGLVTGGIDTVIGQTGRAHQAQTQSLTDAASLARQSYTDLLSQLGQKADYALKLKQLGLQYGNQPYVISQQVVNDAKSGATLRDLLTKYSGRLTPDQLYQIYNTVNTGQGNGTFNPAGGGWGTATETPGQLAQLGIKSPVNTATTLKLNDIATSANAIAQMQQELSKIPSYEGIGGLIGGSILGGKAAAGYQGDVSGYNALVNGLASTIAKGIGRESGNLSTGDVERAKALLPAVTDSTAVRAQKLANLKSLLNANALYFQNQYGGNALSSLITNNTSSGTNTNDPLGLGF